MPTSLTSAPTHRTPRIPRTFKRGIGYTVAAAIAATATAALVLTGCSGIASSGSASVPPVADTQLHPHGDAGSWFSESYSSGVFRTYATSNEVCAITDKVIVEHEHGVGTKPRVVAKDIINGYVLWAMDDAKCSPSRDFAGTVAVGRDFTSERSWELVDIITGASHTALPFGRDASLVTPVTRTGDTVAFEVDSATLTGVSGDETIWTFPLNNADVTPLADGHLGLRSSLDKHATVIDGSTGEATMELDLDDSHSFTWASDGFILRENQSDPAYAFYDIEGNQVDRTVGQSQYLFEPDPRAGVTFPIADHLAAGTVVGVDAQGSPRLMRGEHGRDFSASGELPDLPGSIISLRGVSTAGTMLLFEDEHSERDRLVAIDTSGEEVFDWALPDHTSVRIEAGHIITHAHPTTTVLLASP